VFWKRPVACSRPFERPATLILLRFDLDGAVPGGDHAQFIALLEPEFIDQRLGQSNGEAVAPFGNLHRNLHDMLFSMYIMGRISCPSRRITAPILGVPQPLIVLEFVFLVDLVAMSVAMD
jgi:hypothetical protein